MFEDAGGGIGELTDQPQGAVEIEQIVVGKLLAVQQPGRRQVRPAAVRLDIEGGSLMRVFAIAQRLALREVESKTSGKFGVRAARPRLDLCAEIAGDGPVVSGRRLEGGEWQGRGEVERRPAGA